MRACVFVEDLESRTFLSAGPAPLNSAVTADQTQIKADLLKFQQDSLSNWQTLLGDITAIKTDGLKNAKTVAPLVKQMRQDVASLSATLKQDRLAEQANVLADESVLAQDRAKILADKGNKTALAADKSQFLTDLIKLQTDMVAGLNARLTDRQSAFDRIVADGQAIITAVQSDPSATQQLAADLQKWTADKTAAMNTKTADLQTLIGDRQKLIADLTAMQA